MSKRDSPYLRRALFLAAYTCTLHESPLNTYYIKNVVKVSTTSLLWEQ
ncbi:hypothetical protein [Clostridium cagae]|nr:MULTISPECIES: hypothetical protein [Clostridium]